MASDFCDRTPCKWLQKLFSSRLMTKSKAAELLVSKPKSASGEPLRILTLWYCPFCGTRLYDNKDIGDWIQSRLKG